MLIIYAIALSFHYLCDVLFAKILSNHYDLKKIMINVYFLSFIIMLFFFPKDIIIKPDINYFFIILFSANLIFGLFVWYNAIINNINFGKLDGLSIAIYLPLLVLMSKIVFNQEYNFSNYFGIILISIGAYLTLQ